MTRKKVDKAARLTRKIGLRVSDSILQANGGMAGQQQLHKYRRIGPEHHLQGRDHLEAYRRQTGIYGY